MTRADLEKLVDDLIKRTIEPCKAALKDAGVEYNFYSYPGAVHGFTRPSAGSDKESGIAYDESADAKSWERMKEFLDAKLN